MTREVAEISVDFGGLELISLVSVQIVLDLKVLETEVGFKKRQPIELIIILQRLGTLENLLLFCSVLMLQV